MNEKLNQHIFDQLFEQESTKGQETKLRIVEAAIESFATIGVDKTTYESIAKIAGTSKQLVKNYFPDKRELFVFAIKYIRALFQKFAISSMAEDTDPRESLILYIKSTLRWVKEFRQHATVWALFFYYCGISNDYQQLHSALVKIGHDRLVALINIGKKSKIFKCKNSALSAKMIQSIITGSMITVGTENLNNVKEFETETINLCLKTVGTREI